MDQYIQYDVGQWADEAPEQYPEEPRYAGNHATGVPFEVAFGNLDLPPLGALIDGTYIYGNRFDYNEDSNHDNAFDDTLELSSTDTAEHSIETDVCHRCLFFRLGNIPCTGSSISVINMSKAQLAASFCRICRFIARIIRIQKLQQVGSYLLEALTDEALAERALAGLPMLDQPGMLRFFHIPNRPLTRIVPHLVVANAPFEDRSVEKRYYQADYVNVGQIKGWIHNCHMTHSENCIGHAEYPLRQFLVIDCGSRTVVHAPIQCHYVALSYVWGQHNDAFDDLQNPPKTIVDSIHLTKVLGYRYLWVDRFVRGCHLSLYSTRLISLVYRPERSYRQAQAGQADGRYILRSTSYLCGGSRKRPKLWFTRRPVKTTTRTGSGKNRNNMAEASATACSARRSGRIQVGIPSMDLSGILSFQKTFNLH